MSFFWILIIVALVAAGFMIYKLGWRDAWTGIVAFATAIAAAFHEVWDSLFGGGVAP